MDQYASLAIHCFSSPVETMHFQRRALAATHLC